MASQLRCCLCVIFGVSFLAFLRPRRDHFEKAPFLSVKILFTSTHETSFIKEDLDLLRKSFEVHFLKTTGLRSIPNILRSVTQADVTFTWFASTYSFAVVALARLKGKRSIIVIGGVDAARCPEIDYGIWLSRWKSILVRFAMRNADRLLVVDPFLEKQVIELAGYRGDNIEWLPTGYDPNQWHPGSREKERCVLTVAGCSELARMKMKGLPFLLDVARRMPEVPFTIIGPSASIQQEVRRTSPANVEVIPFTPREDLLEFYQKAAVYCQPSYFDGLPNSVCEAMLCECIPVGTTVGGIPTAIGDTGFLVPYGKTDSMVAALNQGLQMAPGSGGRARARIMKEFTLERRELGLIRVLRELAE